MTAYVLAQLRFRDVHRYRKYQAAFGEVFAKSGARLLCADEAPTLLEGNWTGDKVVLMEFPDEKTAMAWLEGSAYQKIALDRKAGAETTALMLKGVPDATELI